MVVAQGRPTRLSVRLFSRARSTVRRAQNKLTGAAVTSRRRPGRRGAALEERRPPARRRGRKGRAATEPESEEPTPGEPVAAKSTPRPWNGDFLKACSTIRSGARARSNARRGRWPPERPKTGRAARAAVAFGARVGAFALHRPSTPSTSAANNLSGEQRRESARPDLRGARGCVQWTGASDLLDRGGRHREPAGRWCDHVLRREPGSRRGIRLGAGQRSGARPGATRQPASWQAPRARALDAGVAASEIARRYASEPRSTVGTAAVRIVRSLGRADGFAAAAQPYKRPTGSGWQLHVLRAGHIMTSQKCSTTPKRSKPMAATGRAPDARDRARRRKQRGAPLHREGIPSMRRSFGSSPTVSRARISSSRTNTGANTAA